MHRTLRSLLLSLSTAGLLTAALSGQRPTLSYGGKLGTAGPGVRACYLAHPDQAKILVDGGTARKNMIGVLFYSVRMLPRSLPIGPDLLDIDPTTLFLTVPGVLDSQGKWNSSFPIPAWVPTGTNYAVQALVWARGEVAPMRFSRGKSIRILDGGPLDMYVDGDSTKKGNGSPYTPFQTIAEALQAAITKKGARIHIEKSRLPYKGTPPTGGGITFRLGSNTSLIGDSWTGTRSGRPSLNGMVLAAGTPTVPLKNVVLTHLRITPGKIGTKGGARCIGIRNVQGLLIDDCLLEGAAPGQTNAVRGIVIGKSTQGTIRNCTIRRLRVNPVSTVSTVGAYGIVMTENVQVTIRNCSIHDLLDKAISSRVSFFFVSAISCGANQPGSAKNLVTIANNVIGPLVIPKPLGNQTWSDADLMGINLAFGTQGSIRNNVFHKLDLSALTSRTQQIFGISLYEAGKSIELTNNILADFKLGKVTGSIQWNLAMTGTSKSQYVYKASHSCIWNVKQAFNGKTIVPGSVILLKDPLLIPPLYLLKAGSPALNSGNPLYVPRHMGIYGGSFPGRAGIR